MNYLKSYYKKEEHKFIISETMKNIYKNTLYEKYMDEYKIHKLFNESINLYLKVISDKNSDLNEIILRPDLNSFFKDMRENLNAYFFIDSNGKNFGTRSEEIFSLMLKKTTKSIKRKKKDGTPQDIDFSYVYTGEKDILESYIEIELKSSRALEKENDFDIFLERMAEIKNGVPYKNDKMQQIKHNADFYIYTLFFADEVLFFLIPEKELYNIEKRKQELLEIFTEEELKKELTKLDKYIKNGYKAQHSEHPSEVAINKASMIYYKYQIKEMSIHKSLEENKKILHHYLNRYMELLEQ